MRRAIRAGSVTLAYFCVGMLQGACSTSTEPDFSVAFRVERFDLSTGALPGV
jgi:hypothetical protein